MSLKNTLPKSFFYAVEGIKSAVKEEPNFKIHLFLAVVALTLGYFLRLTTLEWLFLTFTIFYVLTLELLNTVLEDLVNLISPDIKPFAKSAKDVSAACVLMAAILAVIVGVVLFAPKLALLFK